jgi:hypothetical protein
VTFIGIYVKLAYNQSKSFCHPNLSLGVGLPGSTTIFRSVRADSLNGVKYNQIKCLLYWLTIFTQRLGLHCFSLATSLTCHALTSFKVDIVHRFYVCLVLLPHSAKLWISRNIMTLQQLDICTTFFQNLKNKLNLFHYQNFTLWFVFEVFFIVHGQVFKPNIAICTYI